uniref:Peptidyl-prolyl cis-trans isomerase n=2 Tax=Brassica oleracea TaxID=3712 RepID=A0A0D3D6T6_BRAOL|nr:unnamed protein product [Brassica oleracea]
MGKDAKAGGKGKGKQASGSDEAPPRGKENQGRLLMRDMYYAKSKERSTVTRFLLLSLQRPMMLPIAAEYLEGPSGKTGGDLGWFPRGKMAGPFQDVAVNTPVGVTSASFKSTRGYHIIFPEGRKN